MDRRAASTVASRGFNDSHVILAPPSGSSNSDGSSAWSATVVIVLVNGLATVLCACAMTCWIVAVLDARRRRRRLRDKVGEIVATLYWPAEADVLRLLRDVETMRSTMLHQDISEFDVLAYKYRLERHDAPLPGLQTTTAPESSSALTTLRLVERLLSSLSLQVPRRRRWFDRIPTPFSRTLCGLARSTAAVWTDEQAVDLRRLVRFFGGAVAAAAFDANRATDAALRENVESRLPYVAALRLVGNRFVLDDTKLAGDVGAFDLRAKIRFIDERLSRPDARFFAVAQWRQTVGAYRAACDLCVREGLVPARTLPDFSVDMATDDARVSECVVLLRHLVRLMCGVPANVRLLNANDAFLRFVAALHDVVHAWNDGTGGGSSMLSCIERSRDNVVAYLRAMSAEQIVREPQRTRAVLERVESELYRHLDYLTASRVREARRHVDDTVTATATSSSAAAAAVTFDGRELDEGTLRPGDSETSIYTMAAAYISPPRRPATSAVLPATASVSASPKRFGAALASFMQQQQQCAERASIVSAASSVYATAAASLSSATNDGSGGGETSAGSARQSPAACHFSPSRSAAAATAMRSGSSGSSPLLTATAPRSAATGSSAYDSDGESYFETPV